MLHTAQHDKRKGHILHDLNDRASEQRHGKDKPVDLLAQNQLFQRADAAAPVVRARDDEVIAPAVRRCFDSKNGVVEKAVGVGARVGSIDGNGDGAGASASKAAGDVVRNVFQLFHGAVDAPGRFLGDRRRFVDDARHCGRRHAGQLGHIPYGDGHRSLSFPHLCNRLHNRPQNILLSSECCRISAQA